MSTGSSGTSGTAGHLLRALSCIGASGTSGTSGSAAEGLLAALGGSGASGASGLIAGLGISGVTGASGLAQSLVSALGGQASSGTRDLRELRASAGDLTRQIREQMDGDGTNRRVVYFGSSVQETRKELDKILPDAVRHLSSYEPETIPDGVNEREYREMLESLDPTDTSTLMQNVLRGQSAAPGSPEALRGIASGQLLSHRLLALSTYRDHMSTQGRTGARMFEAMRRTLTGGDAAANRQLEDELLAAMHSDSDSGDDNQRLARALLEAIADSSAGIYGSSRPTTKLEELIKAADSRYHMPDPDDKDYSDNMDKLLDGGWKSMSQVLATGKPPWEEGHQLDFTSRGGIYRMEKDRVIVAADAYISRILGNQEVNIAHDYESTVDGNELITIQLPTEGESGSSGGSGSSPDAGVTSPGLEKLAVDGTARFEFDDRKTLLSGAVNRLWQGPIVRMIGMDGVICGGAFVRVHAGPSMHLAPLASGDVYGGAAHLSGARIRVAGLGYRSVDSSMWAMGAYIRATSITLEPMIGTPHQSKPFGAARMSQKVGRIAMGVCPFLDIAVGLLMMPISLVMMCIGLVRKRPPKPPAGPPRIRNRSMGFGKEISSIMLHS